MALDSLDSLSKNPTLKSFSQEDHPELGEVRRTLDLQIGHQVHRYDVTLVDLRPVKVHHISSRINGLTCQQTPQDKEESETENDKLETNLLEYLTSFDHSITEISHTGRLIKKALDELLELQRLCKGAQVWQCDSPKGESDNNSISSESSIEYITSQDVDKSTSAEFVPVTAAQTAFTSIKRKLSNFAQRSPEYSASSSPVNIHIDYESESHVSDDFEILLKEYLQELEILARGKGIQTGFSRAFLVKLHQLQSNFTILEKELSAELCPLSELNVPDLTVVSGEPLALENTIDHAESDAVALRREEKVQLENAQRQLCMMLVGEYLSKFNAGDPTCSSLISALKFLKKAQEYGEDISETDAQIKTSLAQYIQQQLHTIDDSANLTQLGDFISNFTRLLERVKALGEPELLKQYYMVLASNFSKLVGATGATDPENFSLHLFDLAPELEGILKEIKKDNADYFSCEAQQVISEAASCRPYYGWIQQEQLPASNLMELLTQLEQKIDELPDSGSTKYQQTEKKIKELSTFLLDKHIKRDTSAYPLELLGTHVKTLVTLSRSVRHSRAPEDIDRLHKTLTHCADLAKRLNDVNVMPTLESIAIYQALLDESENLAAWLDRKGNAIVKSTARLNMDFMQQWAGQLSYRMFKQVQESWESIDKNEHYWTEVEPLFTQLSYLSQWQPTREEQRQQILAFYIEMLCTASKALHSDCKLEDGPKLIAALDQCASVAERVVYSNCPRDKELAYIKAFKKLCIEAKRLEEQIDIMSKGSSNQNGAGDLPQITRLAQLALHLYARVMTGVNSTLVGTVLAQDMLKAECQKVEALAHIEILPIDFRIEAAGVNSNLQLRLEV